MMELTIIMVIAEKIIITEKIIIYDMCISVKVICKNNIYLLVNLVNIQSS